MATFPAPVEPAPLSPYVPFDYPMVGNASPFHHIDGQNRDIILESIRTWARLNLLTWSTEWQTFFEQWIQDVGDYINEHSIAGYSWRHTDTPITVPGATDVTLITESTHPILIGDLVSDTTVNSNYGVVTAIIDDTHATVTGIGSLRGLPGPNSIPADNAVAGFIETNGTATQTAADTRYSLADELVINVKRHGVEGDGATDDTAAIQAVLDTAGNRTVFFPAGTYMVNANLTGHLGLRVTQPRTALLLDPGATIKVITNGSDNYALISITAPDCTIEGGTFQGDVTTHTATTGEWGLLIVVDTGGDRCHIQNTTVKEAWGDGITIQRGPIDVTVTNVTADSNRRQGMSITGCTRARILGGVYKNTGALGATAPAAGIDVEPNPGTGYDVIDCIITDVIAYNNAGPGFLTIRATGQITDVQINNCRADQNGVGLVGVPDSGFRAGGSAGTGYTRFSDCVSTNNYLHGFVLYATSSEATSCEARNNAQNGFELTASNGVIDTPNAFGNGRHGIHVGVGASGAIISGGVSQANGQAATNTYSNFSIDAAGNVRLLGHLALVGSLTNKPKYGYEINTGAGLRMFSCDVSGAYGTSNYLNTPGATMTPPPGFGTAAAIASPTADVTALKTAVDSIRTVLYSAGIILP